VFQTILYAQRRDIMRLVSNVALVPLKFALVALFAGVFHWGAPGAAIATTLTDAVLLVIYGYALYGGPRAYHETPPEDQSLPRDEPPPPTERDGADAEVSAEREDAP
jgi:Na+-driven multidrug efflux pump